MKLVCLNIWGATQGKILFDYLLEQSKTTDIFCLQEVYSAGKGAPKIHIEGRMFGLGELTNLLPDFVPFFEVKSSGYVGNAEAKVDWPVDWGMAMFVRNNIKIQNYTAEIIGKADFDGTSPIEGLVKAQILTIQGKEGKMHIVNMHGMSRPGNKLDTSKRLAQSHKLLNVLDTLPKAPIVLCGDFNLMPETESIRMIEQKFNNLIKTFNITNTRNEISWNRYNNRQYFADYIFASPEIKVKSFEVPYNLVSDHLPMILDFSL